MCFVSTCRCGCDRVHGRWPVLTRPPCAFPQAGQTPLEAARYHNNPEVALLLTKAPQVGLTASSIVSVMWGHIKSWGLPACNLLKPVQTKVLSRGPPDLLTRQWDTQEPPGAARITGTSSCGPASWTATPRFSAKKKFQFKTSHESLEPVPRTRAAEAGRWLRPLDLRVKGHFLQKGGKAGPVLRRQP